MTREGSPAAGAAQKTASSVRNTFEAPNFGSRYLTDDQDVFSQNAWDHVPQPSDHESKVAEALARQRSAPVPDSDKSKYNDRPARYWDLFYKHNADNFFRDRKWLHLEFPELISITQENAGPVTVLEVGCGAGNAVFPLLSVNKNANLKIVACDYAPRAVELVKSHPLYEAPTAGSITASLWDLSSDSLPEGVTANSVDIVVMIFVLSALHPDEWRQAVVNVHRVLKPGGRVLLRDYGRYDLAQLRFKEGRLLSDNFYIRGDKTRVYFFTLDDLSMIFTGSHLSEAADTTTTTVVETAEAEISGEASPRQYNDTPPTTELPDVDLDTTPNEVATGSHSGNHIVDTAACSSPQGHSTNSPSSKPELSSSTPNVEDPLPAFQHPIFSIQQLGVDNRLIVNRKRQLKMHRVWMQGKFIKLPPDNHEAMPS